MPLKLRMWPVTLVGLKETVVNIVTYATMVTLKIEYGYLTIHYRLFIMPVYVVTRVLAIAFVKNTIYLEHHLHIYLSS